MSQAIGSRITQLRERREWSRYRLAKQSGLSFSYLTALEENKHSPSLDVLEKIATGFEIHVSELLREDIESVNQV
jgi:transcriptional regulator with XRE-family HTH domain